MKEKILIIVENSTLPHDPRVWNEAVALHSAGYQVTILCPRGKTHSTDSYELRDGIHIYRHPLPQEGRSTRGVLWEYLCAIFWQVLYSWWIFLRRGFHLIQACNPPDDIVLVALPFKVLGVRFIFDHHDASPELYLAKYGRRDILYQMLLWMEKVTFVCSDVVISTNESYKEIAIKRGGCKPENVFVVRNGPDLGRCRPVAPNDSLRYGKRYLVGYVGVMGKQDGLDLLIDVAEYIRKLGNNDIYFICIGGGPELHDLQEAVKQKNLSDMVCFTGRIPDAEMLEILSTADVCVNPDRPCEMNNISTMIKIMEYMALMKPIVQYDFKEARVSAGDASLYCSKEQGIVDFANKILWLLDHPEERIRMGDSGRKRVEESLLWEYSVPKLLAAYDAAFGRCDSATLEDKKVLAPNDNEIPRDACETSCIAPDETSTNRSFLSR